MAKFRNVPSLSPEEVFLNGAATPNSAPSDAPSSLAIVPPSSTTPDDESTNDDESTSDDEREMVSFTIRIRRRYHDRLMKLATAEERSLSQTARRILEPAIESSKSR
jgi:hypothetical protein